MEEPGRRFSRLSLDASLASMDADPPRSPTPAGWMHMVSEGPAPPKRLTVCLLQDDSSFDVAMYPGTSDRALRCAVAARARLPLTWQDGCESFYLTHGSSDGMVIALCADGIPDGTSVTLHVNPRPSTDVGEEAWPSSGSSAFARPQAPSPVPSETRARTARASLAARLNTETEVPSGHPGRRTSLAARLNTDSETAMQRLAKAQAMVRSRIARKRFSAHLRAERRKNLIPTTIEGCLNYSPCLERLKRYAPGDASMCRTFLRPCISAPHVHACRYAPGYLSNYERVGESADDGETPIHDPNYSSHANEPHLSHSRQVRSMAWPR